MKMHKQLIRVYLLIIFIVVLLFYSFNSIVNQFIDQKADYQIPVNSLIELAVTEQEPKLQKLDNGSLTLSPDLNQRLNQNKVIAVKSGQDQLLFFQMINEQLYSYGPISQITPLNRDNENTILLIFLAILAVAFLLVLIPIARDIGKIQQAARSFSEQPKALEIDVKNTSVVMPIANSMENMSKKLVDLIRIQKDLAITVAHEIRTPLSRLKFVHEQIQENISTKNSSRIVKDISEINTLAEDYLTYSKLDTYSDLLDLELRPLSDLAEIIEDKFNIYRDRFDIDVELHNAHTCYNLQELTIALQNLVMNAMRYTNSLIKIELRCKNDFTYISVRDDGKGLGGKRAHIIEQFNRKACNKNDFGFGLGLYITNLVARKHQGQLTVDNDNELGGAVFTIEFPQTQQLNAIMQ